MMQASLPKESFMSQGYLLAVDAGTGSGRAVLFNTKGEQVAVAQVEWHHQSEVGFAGSMTFETEKNWQLLSRVIKQVLHDAYIKPSEVLAVSATSMREGIVLYDAAGKEVWACANVDARASDEVRELSQAHPDLEQRAYQLSGQTFALGALPRLLWVKRNRPELYEKTRAVTMISDWVLARLCGELATDPSNGGTSGIFNNATRTWASELAKELGLKDDIFPKVLEPGTMLGKVHSKAATETGLALGTPVIMGGGDAQMGCVGLGVVKPGQAAILGGSFWQQEINLAEPLVDPEMMVRINCHAIPNMWQAEAIVFFSGLVMRWFRDTFCQEEMALAKKSGIDTYALLEQQAANVPPGSYGILPIFSDVMRYNRWYHAAPSLLNLSLDSERSSKAAIFRALQENAAIVCAENLGRVERFAGHIGDTLTFASGASKGPLWCQIVSDVTGKSLRVPLIKEATALGTAMAAGVGVGLYNSLGEASEVLVRWERDYTPNPKNTRLYLEVRERWRNAYAAQRALVDQGVTESLWKAPGL
jgi:autoinducer-2 kinase